MSTHMHTTGQLRDFLLNTMLEVTSGRMKDETARSVVKLAGQINESLYAELKHRKLAIEMQQPLSAIGSLDLGEGSARAPTGAASKSAR